MFEDRIKRMAVSFHNMFLEPLVKREDHKLKYWYKRNSLES